MLRRFYHVVDNFYEDADEVRLCALNRSFSLSEGVTGWRTSAFHPTGIKNRIEQRFRVKIKYWERDLNASEACNGVFLSAFSQGKPAERVGVHYDEPVHWMMFLIYLNPEAPRDAGTSFWEHRETGLVCRPTKRDEERLRVPIAGLNRVLLLDSTIRNRWREIDRISNFYNRAVMFPAGLLHSATRHFGNSLSNGRLYQSFHFPIS